MVNSVRAPSPLLSPSVASARPRAEAAVGAADEPYLRVAVAPVVERVARFTPLDAVTVGASALVTGFEALEAELAEWLRAVGIAEGEEVMVLRRGAFGGPLHVRTGSGGEFALHRSLARSILVSPARQSA